MSEEAEAAAPRPKRLNTGNMSAKQPDGTYREQCRQLRIGLLLL